MKKQTLVIIIGLFILALPLMACAEIASNGNCGTNLSWSLDNEGILTISGTGSMTSHPWKTEDVKAVIIQEGVNSITSYAFSECTNLTDVMIANSVNGIGKYAFKNCSAIENIILPDSLTSLADLAFNGCSSLKSISIPESVTSFGYQIFRGCSSLQDVVLPDNLTTISDGLFYDCSSLKEIILPDTLVSIGNQAFRGCSSLKSIVLPESLTSMDFAAFVDCSSLESITIPESLTSIKINTFSDCISLSRVILPPTLQSIAEGVFSGCSSLTEISIPRGINRIAGYTFWACTALKTIRIPQSVQSIADDAFEGCSSLTAISVESIESYAYEWATSKHISVLSSSFIYNKSSGNLVGEPKNVYYSTWSEDPNESKNNTIHSFTRQKLDNGFTRFVLQYTVPENLIISVFDPPDGESISLIDWNLRTSSEKSILQFDLSDEKLAVLSEITIGMKDPNADYRWQLGIGFIPAEPKVITDFKLSSGGTPVGTSREIPFATFGNPAFYDKYMHRAISQKMSNNMTRITLELAVPEGMFVDISFFINEELMNSYISSDLYQVTASNCTVSFDTDDTSKQMLVLMRFFEKPVGGELFDQIVVSFNFDAQYNTSVLRLPENISRIEEEAFANLHCEKIIIPSSCIYIGSRAFANCGDLKFIRIPQKATLESDTFEGCGELWVEQIP